MEINVDLNELISDTFTKVAQDIINCDVNRAILKGGRSSTKSQVASECIIIGIMLFKESAVACVKYANKIEERLVSTFRESIHYLGVEKYWKLRKSPFEYVLLNDNGKETDVSIRFTGCDNPDTLKSYKPRRGSFRYIFFEEVTDHDCYKDVNNLIKTFARGKTLDNKRCVIMCYNPPIQTSNWVNKQYNVPIGKVLGYDVNKVYTEFNYDDGNGTLGTLKQVVHHSTYLDIINSGHADWLGSDFIGEAEKQKIDNNKNYRWNLLGEVVGTEANVFSNIVEWDGNKESLDISEIFRGYDWGYGGPDPCAYVEWYYNRRTNSIYALNDFSKPKMLIDEVAIKIKSLNKHNFPVFADSANKTLNTELKNKGINIINAKKGPDSILAGITWLQSLSGIYINKILTPNIYKEFTQYEYVITKEDEITSKLPDKDNHTIDATRYAFGLEIKYGD